MQKNIILKIVGSLLIICATFIATVVIPDIEKNIFSIEEEITKFYDARILTMTAILSYEGRDVLLAAQDAKYYQMLNLNYLLWHLLDIKKEPSIKEELNKLEKTMQETQKAILENNIWLAIRWSTLLSSDRWQDVPNLRERTNKIRNDKELSTTQKIEKIREIQEESKKISGNRLAEIQGKYFKNLDSKKILDKSKSFRYQIFMWMQILGLSILAFAEVMGEIIKNKEKSKKR